MILFVGAEEYEGVAFEVKVDAIFQRYGACEPYACRHYQMPAAQFLQRLYSLGKGVGVQGNAVRHRVEVGEYHGVVRNLRCRGLGHFRRQIVVVAGIVAGLHRCAVEEQGRQHSGQPEGRVT